MSMIQRRYQPAIVYVINSFDGGGAEAGLIALVRGGLFEGFRLTIVALIRGCAGLEKQLEELGYKPEILLERERMQGRHLPVLFLRLRRLVLRERPDIVIASLPQANLLARTAVFFQRQMTLISFEHNTHLAKRIYEFAYRCTSSRVDWAFADAGATLNEALQRLYSKAPMRRNVVPLISFEQPAIRPSAAAETDNYSAAFHIVSAARFTTVKNQAALIEAVALLKTQGLQVTLTLYGEGPERAPCEELARRLGVASQVRLPGFVQAWPQQGADLFALASRHEGLSLVTLEAMHGGIPVMAPMIGGIRDYGSESNLQVLPAIDARTIAELVRQAMCNRAALRAKATVAADMIDRRFGWRAVRLAYLEINAALMENAQSRRRTCASRVAARLKRHTV